MAARIVCTVCSAHRTHDRRRFAVNTLWTWPQLLEELSARLDGVDIAEVRLGIGGGQSV